MMMMFDRNCNNGADYLHHFLEFKHYCNNRDRRALRAMRHLKAENTTRIQEEEDVLESQLFLPKGLGRCSNDTGRRVSVVQDCGTEGQLVGNGVLVYLQSRKLFCFYKVILFNLNGFLGNRGISQNNTLKGNAGDRKGLRFRKELKIAEVNKVRERSGLKCIRLLVCYSDMSGYILNIDYMVCSKVAHMIADRCCLQ